MNQTLVKWLLGSMALAVVIGCGNDHGLGRVEGTVTLDGKPLSEATVVFIQGQGRPAGAVTGADGKYVLNYVGSQKGALPGNSRVQITTARGPAETEDGQPIAAVPERLPVRYNVQSELAFEVQAGELNIADFALESSGKVAPSSDEEGKPRSRR